MNGRAIDVSGPRTLVGVTDEEWLDAVGSIKQFRANGVRAPHKPLLILLALGRFQRTGSSAMTFSEAEAPLSELLADFGRPANPEYPFHHLQSDGFWTVTMADGGASAATKSRMRAGATGSFVPEFERALAASPILIDQVGSLLLDREFPDTIQPDVLAAVGLAITHTAAIRERAQSLRRRDPKFRSAVLFAYEEQCAFCGFDGLLSRSAVGLEAAHVRWWAFDGPDDVANGLCLCSLHHKLFDLGVLTVDADHRINVSGHFRGRSPAAANHVLELSGRPILEPIAGSSNIDDAHAEWHRTQVFKDPARLLG